MKDYFLKDGGELTYLIRILVMLSNSDQQVFKVFYKSSFNYIFLNSLEEKKRVLKTPSKLILLHKSRGS